MLSSIYQLRPQRSRDDLRSRGDDLSTHVSQQPPLPPPPPAQIPSEMEEPVGCFAHDEIKEIAEAAIEEVIADNTYMEENITMWNNTIIDKILGELIKLKKPYKYIVACTLQQKTGAGLHIASAFYWEPRTDATCSVKWNNDYVHCYLHVFGVMI